MWQWLWGADPEPSTQPSNKSITKTSTLLTIPSKHGDTPCLEEQWTHITPVVNASIKTMDRHQQRFIQISLAMACFGWLLVVVGAATNYWSKFALTTIGLFYYCNGCNVGVWAANQALLIFGLLAATAGMVLMGVSIQGGKPWMPVAGAAACLAGGFSTLLGNIIFAASAEEISRLQASFYLAAVGAFIFLAAGGLAIVKAIR